MADRTLVPGDFQKWVDDASGTLARATTVGIRAATAGLLTELRQMVRNAGLGDRVGNVFASKVYPARGDSLRAAGLVYTRGAAGRQVGEKIIDAFSRGVEITARGGKYLAIPTAAVPRGGGRGNARIGPREVEQRFGRKLAFIQRRGRTPVLALRNDVVAGRRGRFVSAKTGRGARGSLIVMFILVRRVHLAKRFEPKALHAKWLALVPSLIERALPK